MPEPVMEKIGEIQAPAAAPAVATAEVAPLANAAPSEKAKA
ncbi:MAG: hypothetical protein QM765_14330 [Myxococcales bacterium]